MKRSIIEIDREKCNGCGLCIAACHEGALALVDGKATLISDAYCDGLGHCLPQCPVDAIRIIEREAEGFDEQAVQQRQKQARVMAVPLAGTQAAGQPATVLGNWPIQIQLTPVQAPCFAGAHLLIAADCTAFAYEGFHREFLQGRVCLIGCPKLDAVDYSEKLTEILAKNDIKSVTILRMEVPCCAGLANAAMAALQNCGKMIPWGVEIIRIEGERQPL